MAGRFGQKLSVFCFGTLAVAATVFVPGVAAQEPLVTDRPDFTESSSTVGGGVVQIEAGTTYLEGSGGTDVFTFGEALVRWGVAEKLELRFVLPTYSYDRGLGSSDSGFLDSAVGLKFDLKKSTGNGFISALEAAVIASTTVPTGSSSFSSPAWQPTAVLAASWELSPSVGIGSNLGVAWPSDGDRRFTSAWLSAVLGVGITQSTSMFFELFAFDREESRGPNTVTFQTGVVYLLSPDLQFDVRAARRLSSEGVNILLGAGVSWRIGG